MKFIPNKTTEQQIEGNLSQVKHKLRTKQHPKKHAPAIPCGLNYEICGGFFALHKQDKGTLVLTIDSKACFESGVSTLRIERQLP